MKNAFLILVFTISCIFSYGCASSFNIPDAEKQPTPISEEENDKIKQAVKFHDGGGIMTGPSVFTRKY